MNENANKLGVAGPGGIHCHCCSYERKTQRKLLRAARRMHDASAVEEGYQEYQDNQNEDEGTEE